MNTFHNDIDPYCDCFECTSPDKLLMQRETPSNNFDMQDLKILALKADSLVTLNPDLYKYTKAASNLKNAIKRADASPTKTTKLTPEEQKSVNDVRAIEERTQKIEGVFTGFLDKFKWLFIAVGIILVIALFLRIKG